uniref:PBX homeobox interacting protein 1 n=1 Tax=Marmota marmota marmota TaxID=9994 RepID=A0A8C5ZT75_MARMA
MATCPDVDNSWVLAGSESLPVETLGPEPRVDPESERALLAPGSPPKAVGEESPAAEGEGTLFQTESPQCDRILPGEPEVKGPLGGGDCDVEPPGPGDAVVQEDSQETPETTSLGPDTQDLGDQSPLQSLSTTPKAGESPFALLLEGSGEGAVLAAEHVLSSGPWDSAALYHRGSERLSDLTKVTPQGSHLVDSFLCAMEP